MDNQQVSQITHPVHTEYSCDFEGRVYKRGRFLKGTIATTGYRQYGILRKSILGHRFVTECREGRVLETHEHINHLDFDKLNNKDANLEITTASGNMKHYWENQEIDTSNINMETRVCVSGEKNPMARLNNDTARSLILDLLSGMTNTEAGDKYGLHSRYVSLVRHKKRWKIVWKYLNLETSTTSPSGCTPK